MVNDNMNKVKVRYGPSPTGIPHVGNIRTALFNYLFAKNQKGQFLLRIEDTDQNRLVPDAVEKIKDSLTLLNLNWDEQIIYQSKRLDLYKKSLEILISKKLAYQDEGATRFKIKTDKNSIGWEDAVHGHIEFPTNVLEDFIIMKSDGFPTYHFASVVDDHDLEITHVMRGDEWISSTPKHLLLYEALGWQPPKFVHMPPILGPDKNKLSKRHGAKSVHEFIDEGYLPEAIINFMAFLGWSPQDNQEIFSLDELSKVFSLDRINKNTPIFNIEKLDWFNKEWIKKMSDDALSHEINKDFPEFNVTQIKDILPLVKDRIGKVTEFKNIANLFFEKPNLQANKKEIAIKIEIFTKIINSLKKLNPWGASDISTAVNKIMEEEQLTKSQMYKSLGIAISGQLITPPIFPSMEKLGKEETIDRLKTAHKVLQK